MIVFFKSFLLTITTLVSSWFPSPPPIEIPGFVAPIPISVEKPSNTPLSPVLAITPTPTPKPRPKPILSPVVPVSTPSPSPTPQIVYVYVTPYPTTYPQPTPRPLNTPTPLPPTPIPEPTPVPTPTPIPVIIRTGEFFNGFNGYDGITTDIPTNKVKSITLEVYERHLTYPNGIQTEALPPTKLELGNWRIYISIHGYAPNFIGFFGKPEGDLFRDLLITSNPMTIPVNQNYYTFWPKNSISSGISCQRGTDGECMTEPQLTFKLLSADGAIIERN